MGTATFRLCRLQKSPEMAGIATSNPMMKNNSFKKRYILEIRLRVI